MNGVEETPLLSFASKPEAYSHAISFLSDPKFKDNEAVKDAREKIMKLFEDCEQDPKKVSDILQNLISQSNLAAEDKAQLSLIIDGINKSTYQQTPQQRFENPHRRMFDSLMAIELLKNPTGFMLKTVKEISDKIVNILENYEDYDESQKQSIDAFLRALKNLEGPDPTQKGNQYQAAISLGSFKAKPDINTVCDVLKNNKEEDFAKILHIHFKFALVAARNLPQSITPKREPKGKLKALLEEKYQKNGYKTFQNNLNKENEQGKEARGYISDEVIYKNDLYRDKGKEGTLNYDVKSKRLGLMLTSQETYESNLPEEELPWVPDAKAQKPNFDSRMVKDLIDNDAIYVAGPSGMASLMLGDMEMLGNFDDVDKKQAYLAATCGYIVGGGFHSFHEVLGPAQHCLDLVPGYNVQVPDVEKNTQAPPPNLGVFLDTLNNIDTDFEERRDKVWDKYNKFCQPMVKKMDDLVNDQLKERLYSVLTTAQVKYHKWISDNANSSGKVSFFNPHGRQGLQRAIVLVGNCKNKNFQEMMNEINNFFNDNLTRGDQKLPGKARARNHSFISFLLNELKSEPHVINKINENLSLGTSLTLDKTIDYTSAKAEKVRHEAFKVFKSMPQSDILNMHVRAFK